MVESARKKSGRKLPKDFPLWLHPSGRWCKKIRGRAHYFGKADDPRGALDRYLAVKDDLHAGRMPRTASGGLTVKDLVNRFLSAKRLLVDSKDLSPRTWRIYRETCGRVVAAFGRGRSVADLRPEDFEKLRASFAATLGPAALKVGVTCTKSLFKYGYEAMLLDVPVRFGPTFKGASKRAQAQVRNRLGEKMFSAEEIREFLEAGDASLGCWILLGVQAGFGNQDLATLEFSALDLEGGWVSHPRPKNGTPRRCPLIPETVDALQTWLKQRPEPADKENSGLVFLSKVGKPLSRVQRTGNGTGQAMDLVADSFLRLRKRVSNFTPGRGFYTLRHVAETVMGESVDQPAVDHIMGHVTPGMGTVYRERISDGRLQDVVAHVHEWLFGVQKEVMA